MPDPAPLVPETEPGTATPEDGIVILDGPHGVALSMHPEPAEETGHRLIEAARQAKDQRDEPA